MTNTKNRVVALLLLALSTIFAAKGALALGEAPVGNLKELLAKIQDLRPYDKHQLEQFFNIRFSEVNAGASRNYGFWLANSITLGATLRVEQFDLRLGHTEADQSLLNLNISGECLSISDIEAIVGVTQSSSQPTGHSLDESYWHKKNFPWGHIAFEFKDGPKTSCLVGISIARSPDSKFGPSQSASEVAR